MISVGNNKSRPVWCLGIDLKKSTELGFKLIQEKYFQLYEAIVNQITTHLEMLDLKDIFLKFTGDGWLLVVEDINKLKYLMYLALIMKERFIDEIYTYTGIDKTYIPSIKLAICQGTDKKVVLPNGQDDWIGDSIRRTNRALGKCEAKEILVEHSAIINFPRDFICSESPLDRPEPHKFEENLILYKLNDLRICHDAEADPKYTYTLRMLNRKVEADQNYDKILHNLKKRSGKYTEQITSQGFNATFASSGSYEDAMEVKEEMNAYGFKPSVEAYNSQIIRSNDFTKSFHFLSDMFTWGLEPTGPMLSTAMSLCDYHNAKKLMDDMYDKGVEKSIFPYNTLLDKAPDFYAVTSLEEEIKEKGLAYTPWTYSTLIRQAPDFGTAKRYLEKMEKTYRPDFMNYIEAFKKDLFEETAESILQWFLRRKWHPEFALTQAMISFKREGKLDEAIFMAICYHLTETSLEILVNNIERALYLFKEKLNAVEKHPTAKTVPGGQIQNKTGDYTELIRVFNNALGNLDKSEREKIIKEWLRKEKLKLEPDSNSSHLNKSIEDS